MASLKYVLCLSLVVLTGYSAVMPKGAESLEKRQSESPCPGQLHVIGLPGAGVAQDESTDGFGLLNTLIQKIQAAFPENTVYRFPYGDGKPYTQINNGPPNLKQDIQNHVFSCPNTPIVLASYSEGAIVTMDTLCGSTPPFTSSQPISGAFSRNVIATVLYGDETRTPNQPYDKGTCTRGGDYPRQNPSGCGQYIPSIVSYCDLEDVDCCMGRNKTTHYQYGIKYDNSALAFIKQKYNAFRGTL